MLPLDEWLQWLWREPAPQPVRDKARLLLLDTLGCALAGLQHPTVARLAAAIGGHAAQSPQLLATAACWDEACEGLARAHGRPGVPVIAACLPLVHQRQLGTFLDAIITGYEIGGRMGEALRIRPGMHVDGCWPALGAAAAVVRLLGGTAEQARAAIEIAASQLPYSLYLPVEQGADGRNTYLGHTAWLGTYAAQAALAGCVAPQGAVDRFAELALGGSRTSAPAGTYVLLEGYLKRHAAVRHVHYGVEAALVLRAEAGRIDALTLTIYPEALAYCGNRAPRAPIAAQFSLSFGLAAALRFGRLTPEEYRVPRFEDTELRRLEALVVLESNEGQQERGARLRVLSRGRVLERTVNTIPGDPAQPMSREECLRKFVDNAGARAGRAVEILIAAESTPMPELLKALP